MNKVMVALEVTLCISKCVDVDLKDDSSVPNQRAWKEAVEKSCFGSDDKEANSTARARLRAAIKEAKQRQPQTLTGEY